MAKETRGAGISAPDVRERAIGVVLALYEEGGLERVRAREVAARSGISVGSLYNLFGDLDELIRRANARIYDKLRVVGAAALERATAENAPPRERLLVLCRAYVEFVEVNAKCWSAALAFDGLHDAHPAWYVERQRATLSVIEDAIADRPRAVADGALRRRAARTLFACIYGVLALSMVRIRAGRTSDQTWRQVELVIAALDDYLSSPPDGEG